MARESYLEMIQRHQKEIDEFPMVFAFNDSQLKEALEKLDAKVNEVTTLGLGTIIRIKDVEAFIKILERVSNETFTAMSDPSFAYEAFLYEIGNIEYSINSQADWDLFSMFGNVEYKDGKTAKDYCKELGFSNEIYEVFKKAREDYMKIMVREGWA